MQQIKTVREMNVDVLLSKLYFLICVTLLECQVLKHCFVSRCQSVLSSLPLCEETNERMQLL